MLRIAAIGVLACLLAAFTQAGERVNSMHLCASALVHVMFACHDRAIPWLLGVAGAPLHFFWCMYCCVCVLPGAPVLSRATCDCAPADITQDEARRRSQAAVDHVYPCTVTCAGAQSSGTGNCANVGLTLNSACGQFTSVSIPGLRAGACARLPAVAINLC